MRNWKSFFLPEDFEAVVGPELSAMVAEKANQLINQGLAEALEVHGEADASFTWYRNDTIGATNPDNMAKGRVVAIEERTIEEFELAEQEFERLGLNKKEPWFDKMESLLPERIEAMTVPALIESKSKGVTLTPVPELNRALRGGLRAGEVTFLFGDQAELEALHVLTLTAFQHHHRVLRLIDGADDYFDHDRFPDSVEIYKFARFNLATIEKELSEFISEVGATFVVLDAVENDAFYREDRPPEYFRLMMNAVRQAAKALNCHIVISSGGPRVHADSVEGLPAAIVELANNVIQVQGLSGSQSKMQIEVVKCDHETNFGRFQTEFKCLKPSEWTTVLREKKWNEIED